MGVYSSPLGDTFAVKFLTSHFRGNDVADILEGVVIACEKNTALFPFPTPAALKLDYNNGRGEYHLSQYHFLCCTHSVGLFPSVGVRLGVSCERGGAFAPDCARH